MLTPGKSKQNIFMDIKNVEIFAQGFWNGTEITAEHLAQMAKNFLTLGQKIRVPLKFGHNKEQPITDGQPALGWVINVRTQDKKLLADFEDVPETVFQAIKLGRYDRVSAEVLFGVEIDNKDVGAVLVGVALLGADLPAITDLEGLSQLVASLDMTSIIIPDLKVFTLSLNGDTDKKDSKNYAITMETIQKYKENNGGLDQSIISTMFKNYRDKNNMDDKNLEARLEKLEQQLKDSGETTKQFKQKAIDAETELKKFKDDEKKRQIETTHKLFCSTREELIKQFDNLVKTGDLTPAIRDQIDVEAKAQEDLFSTQDNKLFFSADTLLAIANTVQCLNGQESQYSDTTQTKNKTPDEILDIAVKTIMVEQKLDYNAAMSILENDESKSTLLENYNIWQKELN